MPLRIIEDVPTERTGRSWRDLDFLPHESITKFSFFYSISPRLGDIGD